MGDSLFTSTLLDMMNEAVFVTREPSSGALPPIKFLNDAFLNLLGEPEEDVIGSPPSAFMADSELEDPETLKKNINSKNAYKTQTQLKTAGGNTLTCILKITEVRNPDKGNTFWVYLINEFQDEQDRDELKQLAYYDRLTGLPNRNLFFDRLKQTIERAKRNNQKFGLLFLDLDQFKQLNDTLGHQAGDKILQHTAERVENCLRASDTVARLGGDEFTVLVPDINNHRDVREVIRKIFTVFQTPFDVSNNNIKLSTSLGVSIYPEHGDEAQTLLNNADAAMYQAKGKGGNSYQFYLEEVIDSQRRGASLETDLADALDHNEMELHFQPIFSLENNRTIALEALIRWNHPERGLIRPSEFLPLAEMSGFINDLDQWVIEQTARQISGLNGDTSAISVNLSGQFFRRDDCDETIQSILRDANVAPDRLVLEVTEETAMRDVKYTASKFNNLSERGIRLLLDDFGTGPSSLKYLRQFPIDFIKIGEEIVNKSPHQDHTNDFIKTILTVAEEIDVTPIAEGVENQEQLTFLRNLGCDVVQGHLLSGSIPLEQISNDIFDEDFPTPSP